ncbi:Alpha/beta hydrolase domain-containing protein 2 [Elsinoe fawcettii]|nr:Alpha/beta hydrolase domain-containing protein 2 [Elsinoe fawcettii]
MPGQIIHDIKRTGAKKLIVCCDGTWMDSDNGNNRTPSNVTRLARAIRPEDEHDHSQIVYYQAGIGTGLGLFAQVAGGGTGLGFSENVREAYAFLANNYHKADNSALDRNGDETDSIFLIGFSRGAYTARSLGGLVGQLGLLKKEHMNWFYDIFEDWQNAGNPDYTPRFWTNFSRWNVDVNGKEPHSISSNPNDVVHVNDYLEDYRKSLLALKLTQEADIAAIGVFDTVGALGVPVNPFMKNLFKLPAFLHKYMWVDTSLDNHVKNAFQALALDEHRAPFFPSVWERPDGCRTNLKQVWFAGAHSSIGGAYPDIAQANITLAWMMDQLSGDELKRANSQEWHPKDWLHFDRNFIKEQKKLNDDWQKRHYAPASATKVDKAKKIRNWGMGAIYNSLTFPHILAGSRTRRPGRTHPVTIFDYESQDRLLWNTNEKIHSSVRIRINHSGHEFETNPRDSIPQKVGSFLIRGGFKLLHMLLGRTAEPYYHPHIHGPLTDWTLRDGFKYHDDYAFNTDERPTGQVPYWEYVGKDPLMKKGGNPVMMEDELGTHEMMLLDEYGDTMADYVIGSNKGKKSVDDHPHVKRDSIHQKSTTY